MSPTRSLTPRVGDTPLRRPPPPSPDCGRRSGSGVRRCHRAGWDWRKRRGGRAPGMGVASGGRSGLGGPRAPRAGRGCQGRRRARGAPALRPELQLLLPGLPGPGSPRRACSGGRDPAGHAPTSAAPRRRARGTWTRTSCSPRPGPRRPPPSAPRSLFPACLLPSRRLRLRWLGGSDSGLRGSGPRAAEGAAGGLLLRGGAAY